MPYDIAKRDDEYCVYLAGERDNPLGCHATEEEAEAQVRALYAQEADMKEQAVFNSFSVELFASDADVAVKALNGAPVLIIPMGPVHHPATGQKWDIDAARVQRFADNFARREERGIRRRLVAVDVDHDRRAVGWYDTVQATPRGVEASFRWNKAGRELLEAGSYAYFSPTLAFEYLDPKSGAVIEDVIVGGAITNYPVFGGETALYSLQEGGGIMPEGENLEGANVEQAVERGVRGFFASLFGGGGDGDAPPVNEGAGVTVEQFSALQEEFAGLRGQLEAVTNQRDDFAGRVEALGGQLSQVQELRQVERFSVMAENFAHLPTATGDLASQLRWLFSVDSEDEQPHAAFFVELLQSADAEFSAAFAAIGDHGQPLPDSAAAEVMQLAAAYQEEHAGADLNSAMSAVFASKPGLYAQYRQEMGVR